MLYLKKNSRINCSMEKFTLEKVYRVLENISTPKITFDRKVQLLCDALLSLGTHSVRYYEAVYDRFSLEKSQFILTHAAYHTALENSVVGIRIGLNDTTLTTARSGANGIARGHIAEATDQQRQTWIERLGISGTQWIDLEITSGGSRVGLLAMSWTGSKDLISEEDEFALRLIRSTIGNLYASSFGADEEFDASLNEFEKAVIDLGSNSKVSLDRLTSSISELVSADSVCIFRYDWVSGQLEKVSEKFDDNLTISTYLDETYCVGNMLTGKAFLDEKFRFIPDFSSFLDRTVTAVESDSLKYHNDVLGELKSVAYFLIGTKSNRLLIRCFRGGDSEYPPFTDRDFGLICQLADIGTKLFDFELLERQKIAVQEAAIDGLKAFTDSTKLFEIIGAEIEALGCESYICAHFSKTSTSTEFIRGSAPIEDARKIFGKKAIDAWEVLQRLPAGKRSFEISRSDFQKLGQKHVASAMSENGWHAFGCIRISAGEASTIIFIPLQGILGKGWIPFNQRLENNEVEHLSSLISIFGASLEAKSSHISAENADDLLANIGHELQTPITEIEQSAIDACERCHELIDGIEGRVGSIITPSIWAENRRALDLEIETVTKKAELLRHFMDIPRIMSEFFGGDSMPVSFNRVRWRRVIDDSWKSAFSWANEMSDYYPEIGGRASFGEITLETNKAMEGMACVMSEPLVKMALTNLLKNAIKFSLPRYNRKMIIEVRAIPQTGWNIIQVTNWGIGIEREQFEEIFGKYHRIDRLDAKRDIAGRGLGLYLARAMVRAQGGHLFCESSEWTLDDKAKRDQGVGFLTTFELRIPTTISPGNRKVNLQ